MPNHYNHKIIVLKDIVLLYTLFLILWVSITNDDNSEKLG